MKKTTKRFAIITSAVVLIICIILSVVIFFQSQVNKYVLSPFVCEAMLGVTPSDFVASDGADSFIGNNYLNANVNDDGDLVLTLNDSQVDFWKSNIFSLRILSGITGDDLGLGVELKQPDNSIEEIFLEEAHKSEIEISNDYTKITVPRSGNRFYYNYAVGGCVAMQCFDGKSRSEIKVEYVELDASGAVATRIILPDDIDK